MIISGATVRIITSMLAGQVIAFFTSCECGAKGDAVIVINIMTLLFYTGCSVKEKINISASSRYCFILTNSYSHTYTAGDTMRWTFNRLFPQYCLCCLSKTKRAINLCHGCELELPWVKTACTQCDAPLNDDSQTLCGKCAQNHWHFDFALAPLLYQKPIDKWIKQFKFHHHTTHSPLLAHFIHEKIRNRTPVDCLIPTPLHRKRWKKRGFNQATLIAHQLHKLTNIPLDTDTAMRKVTRFRKANVPPNKDIATYAVLFIVKIKYQSAAIIDDVFTTGSTVNELARCLKSRCSNTLKFGALPEVLFKSASLKHINLINK